MINILARSSVMWLNHFGTFCCLLAVSLAGKQAHMELAPLVLLPIWVTSSVFFSEREESYAFLRTLPVTDRQIVQVKFGLALGALVVYGALVAMFLAGIAGDGPEPVRRLKWMAVSWSVSLILAAACYLGLWRFGRTVITVIAGTAIPLYFAAAMLWTVGTARGSRAWGDAFAPHGALDVLVCAGMPCVALLAFFGLFHAAVRVKESSEAHLH